MSHVSEAETGVNLAIEWEVLMGQDISEKQKGKGLRVVLG